MADSNPAVYLGYAAGVLTVASFVPQVVRTWRTRQTGDLSLGMFALLVVSAGCWTAYGVLTGDAPVIATNLSVVLLNALLVIAKVRFGRPLTPPARAPRRRPPDRG